jgi:hypothetical protein
VQHLKRDQNAGLLLLEIIFLGGTTSFFCGKKTLRVKLANQLATQQCEAVLVYFFLFEIKSVRLEI